MSIVWSRKIGRIRDKTAHNLAQNLGGEGFRTTLTPPVMPEENWQSLFRKRRTFQPMKRLESKFSKSEKYLSKERDWSVSMLFSTSRSSASTEELWRNDDDDDDDDDYNYKYKYDNSLFIHPCASFECTCNPEEHIKAVTTNSQYHANHLWTNANASLRNYFYQ